MRDIGRLAFPLFCFLLIEGYLHTRSKVRYGVSLGVMALISEIPFDLERQNKLFDLHVRNIFPYPSAGLSGDSRCRAQWKSKHPISADPGADRHYVGCRRSGGLRRACSGVAHRCLRLRQNEFFRLFSAFLLGNSRFVMLAFLPMSLYNGKRGFIKGKFLKYAFYAIYPVHIFIIYLLKLHCGLFQ